MLTLDALRAHKAEIMSLAEKHGARNLRVFGSVARGDAGETSDIDFLVEWEANRSLLDHVGLKLDLEDMLGRRVDIGTERSLHRFIRQQVLSEAVPL